MGTTRMLFVVIIGMPFFAIGYVIGIIVRGLKVGYQEFDGKV